MASGGPADSISPRRARRTRLHKCVCLAHSAGIPDLEERLLPALVAVGLQGLECYYGRYDDATVERLVGLANQHALIPTGETPPEVVAAAAKKAE